MNSPTREEICCNYKLWLEYVDTQAKMSEKEFDDMSLEECLKIMQDCLGPEMELGEDGLFWPKDLEGKTT